MATGFPFSVIPANSCPAICGDSKSEENKCISVPHIPEVKILTNTPSPLGGGVLKTCTFPFL